MSDEYKLRKLLAIQCAGEFLYHDDGELQDNRYYPFIDFLRDSPDAIELKMRLRVIPSTQGEGVENG